MQFTGSHTIMYWKLKKYKPLAYSYQQLNIKALSSETIIDANFCKFLQHVISTNIEASPLFYISSDLMSTMEQQQEPPPKQLYQVQVELQICYCRRKTTSKKLNNFQQNGCTLCANVFRHAKCYHIKAEMCESVLFIDLMLSNNGQVKRKKNCHMWQGWHSV